MKTKTSLRSSFRICNRGNIYIIGYIDGRDVFYFRPPKNPMTGISFPHNISVNISFFEDHLMYFCIQQIATRHLNEEKLLFFLTKIFNRMLEHDNYELFFIEDCILDRNGQYNELLHNYFNDRYIDMFINPYGFYSVNVPYSLSYNKDLFLFMTKEIIWSELKKKVRKIDRTAFEAALVSKELADAYVEEYNHESLFYYEQEIDSHNNGITGGYLMILESRVQLIVLSNLKEPAYIDAIK